MRPRRRDVSLTQTGNQRVEILRIGAEGHVFEPLAALSTMDGAPPMRVAVREQIEAIALLAHVEAEGAVEPGGVGEIGHAEDETL